jgi:hypothetical protein
VQGQMGDQALTLVDFEGWIASEDAAALDA